MLKLYIFWSGKLDLKSRAWQALEKAWEGALRRARISSSPCPSQLFVAISLITADVSFSDSARRDKFKALFPVVSTDIR